MSRTPAITCLPLSLAPKNCRAAQAVNYGGISCTTDFLKPEHFANAMHARMLEAIQKLVDRGQTASPVTLKATFDQDTALAPNDGARYLAKLASAGASLTRVEVEVYARLVYDHWQRRELIAFGEEVVGSAYRAELDDPASVQIERAESWLYRLAESGDTGSGFRPLSAATGRAIEIADAAYKRGARIVSQARWDAEWQERKQQPLYEALAEAFDFSDPDLWRSNSFASLRPRLVVWMHSVVLDLQGDPVSPIPLMSTRNDLCKRVAQEVMDRFAIGGD
jgi:hypothetical protein